MKYKQPQLTVPINEPDFTYANHIKLCLRSFHLLKLWCGMQRLFDYFQKIEASFVYAYKHFTCVFPINVY